MPALSPTMESGTLAKWLVKEGDSVKGGDLLAEIETDKATMEFEAVDEGVLVSILVSEGTDDVAVGTVIAIIGEAGEGGAARPPELPPAKAAPSPAAPAPPVNKASPEPAPRPIVSDEARANATPLARRIAAATGQSLTAISGSGPGGRIVKADLEPPAAAALPRATPPAAPSSVAQAPPAGVPMQSVRLSGMRRTIARRLTEAKQTVPHFYLTAHCRIDALLALRGELNTRLAAHGAKLSVNDFLIKALALALMREPDANVQFAGDEIHHFTRADIAMAVAVEGGLITPVIRDASGLSLSAISSRSKQLAARARDGALSPEEYQGGTASISNLGMYGIDEMIPVINPPQALILGIGSGIEKPWKVDGGIALATIMSATASFDHRAIDGAAAARFMAAFRDLVEQPIQIVC